MTPGHSVYMDVTKTSITAFALRRNVDLTNIKAFADKKLNVAQVIISVFEGLENIVGKGENAGYQHFPFIQFSKVLFFGLFNILLPACFSMPTKFSKAFVLTVSELFSKKFMNDVFYILVLSLLHLFPGVYLSST